MSNIDLEKVGILQLTNELNLILEKSHIVKLQKDELKEDNENLI